jgi:hypothetical protein
MAPVGNEAFAAGRRRLPVLTETGERLRSGPNAVPCAAVRTVSKRPECPARGLSPETTHATDHHPAPPPHRKNATAPEIGEPLTTGTAKFVQFNGEMPGRPESIPCERLGLRYGG